MLISIIIPVYNADKFLAATIQSALNQTYKDTEIILVDDGSTDKSGDIIDDFQIRYPEKIRTLTKRKNTGEAIARKEGISKSQGEWIYLLDSDDIMYPDAIERLVAGITETDAQVILGHRDCIDANSYPLGNDTSMRWKRGVMRTIPQLLLIKNPLTPGNLLIARTSLSSSDFETSIRYGEDWLLFVRLAHRSSFFCIGGTPVYSYRVHSHQQSRSSVSFSERKKVLSALYVNLEVQKKYPGWKLAIFRCMAQTRLGIWHISQRWFF